MKKLICIILMMMLAVPCAAYAAGDYLLPVGPYTYDAAGCSLYNYHAETYIGVEYTALEAYAGFGMGFIHVQAAFLSYEELGMTREQLLDAYATESDWELAAQLVDANYGMYSDQDTFLGYKYEETDPCLSPAAALFTCPISDDYGGGHMSGAVLVSAEGVMFFECYAYGGGADVSMNLRSDMLDNLSLSGVPVKGDTPNPDAPEGIPGEDAGMPVTVETAGGFSFDIEGWTQLDDRDKNSIFISYPTKAVYINFFPSSGNDYSAAEYLYDFIYMQRSDLSYLYEHMEIESAGDMPFLFSGILKDEYGGGYMTGAIVANENGLLVIEIDAYTTETSYDDLDIFREGLLDTLRSNGQPLSY